MNQLQVIVHRQARVLTTSQLAESYGADKQLIVNNFNRNKDRYTEGKHFVALEGPEKNDFIDQHQIDLGSKNAKALYLWTEKGALLHAKSLNTDKAWEAYEMLVDSYFNIIEQKPLTAREQVQLLLRANEETAERVDVIEKRVNVLHDTMRIDGRQEHALKEQGKAKVFEVLGGYGSPAYEKLSRKIFSRMWGDFKKHFILPRSMELPKAKFDEAVQFIAMWRPDTTTAIEIEAANKQAQFKLVE